VSADRPGPHCRSGRATPRQGMFPAANLHLTEPMGTMFGIEAGLQQHPRQSIPWGFGMLLALGRTAQVAEALRFKGGPPPTMHRQFPQWAKRF